MCEAMDVLINSIRGNPCTYTHISNHIEHFKYLTTLIVDYTLIKLKKRILKFKK